MRTSSPALAPSSAVAPPRGPEPGATPAGSRGVSPPQPYTPPRCDVPAFPPILIGGRGGRRLLRRAVRRHRGTIAAGLAVTAAVLALSAPRDTPPRRYPAAARGLAPAPAAARQGTHEVVRAPVRIADAAAVALLRPGDRVDVLAGARIVATAVEVVTVTAQPGASPAAGSPGDGGTAGGSLVVLAVPRATAAELSEAALSSPLAVTLC
jgi:hypothetical protein